MYILLLSLLMTAGAVLMTLGFRRRSVAMAVGGFGVLLATAGFFSLLSFWGEMLWFEALGYSDRFWTVALARIGLGAAGAIVGGLFAYLLTRPIPRGFEGTRFWPEALGVLIGGWWGVGNWDSFLLFWNAVSTGQTDPILGRDVGFYVFRLPFLDSVYWLLLFEALVACFAAAVFALAPQARRWESTLPFGLHVRGHESSERPVPLRAARFRPLAVALGGLLFVLAGGKLLNPFHLLFSQGGVVAGASWTDVHVRLPAHYVLAALTALAGIALVAVGLSQRLSRRFRFQDDGRASADRPAAVLGGVAGGLALLWFAALAVVPALFQWLRVDPNEITIERPYITHNIAYTRRAFDLHDFEDREFPASEQLTAETVENNRHVLSQIRLWDPRALIEVYSQFQEIRLYYEFDDVDIDRYTIGGDYRQVMVSPREIEPDNLPETSQTFVNRRFKYTHGYGLTLAPVSEFTRDGLPNLLVKDIPPQAEFESLEVKRPQIYYGELTDEPVVVNTSEGEFDYPRGDTNVYIHYDGTGGVELKNLWRKFVFGWMFDGTRFLLSGYPRPESRVMFDRDIRRRVQKLAPFLTVDADPYLVLNRGRLYWIVDCYTTADTWPYSEALRGHDAVAHLDGVNYLRNAVKAVVDAYDGDVTLYVFEPEDPVIQTWRRIFPELFRDRDEMPPGLFRHVRYPEGLLLAQGLVYAKYHMTDPDVFYNQEDLWVRATEKYYGGVQPVEPYYVMWEPPESDDLEFVLMQPFTPKDKQVLIGWIAGMSDGENYGRLVAYQFPKEKRVLGTQQVETKIDQDPYLSERLTLWDQRGSRVIRGNLLVIPINDTLLYVEPIYLQAEAAAYPELRLVITMHGDQMSYAETFEDALRGLLPEAERRPRRERPEYAPGPEIAAPVADLVQQASDNFESYLRLTGEQRFQAAARELQELRESLEQLQDQTSRLEPQQPVSRNESPGEEETP